MSKHKLIMTKGLPASGKTTWAKIQLVVFDSCVRVNKDDLREMLYDGHWTPSKEKTILAVRDLIIKEALSVRDRSVIVDDTNFAPKHEAALRHLALLYGAEFEIKDFSHVPLEVCLERNADRSGKSRVSKKVIMDMYEKYLYKKPVPPAEILGAPYAIICDIDGTLAEMVDRGPYDTNVENDLVREHVRNLVAGYFYDDHYGYTVIFISGRKEAARLATEKWLQTKAGFFGELKLFMRANDDNRRDSIVKREIYDREIAGKYNVIAVFDDRPQVIRECWRPLGLPVFDVGDGREF